MKNTFGNNLSVTIFGESHGEGIGVVLDGLCAGLEVNEDYIRHILSLRRPSSNESTSRREDDVFTILSGVFNGKTTGTPISIIIPNSDTKSNDYDEIKTTARPSHADYTAHIKYKGFEDFRGGGHFSGRITAALCAAGAIALSALSKKGILVGSHIKRCGSIEDRGFENIKEDLSAIAAMPFAVLNFEAERKMREEISAAKLEGDSLGGMLETAVFGLPAGVGEPFFDSLESIISHAVFSVPAVKGIEFGLGFSFCNKKGSQTNDAFEIVDDRVVTKTNNSGGINGGISNGMPIVFRTAIRPTPTISKTQNTIDFEKMKNTTLAAKGRHDPCIVHRAGIVVTCATAIAVCDMLMQQFGKEWLGE